MSAHARDLVKAARLIREFADNGLESGAKDETRELAGRLELRAAAEGAARAARITGGARTRKEVDRYLPINYSTVIVESYPGGSAAWSAPDAGRGLVEDERGRQVEIAIVGVDVAGWTLDDYVIPRLASGLIWAEEIISDREKVARTHAYLEGRADGGHA